MRESASDGRAVVKTGLLPGAEHVRALVELRERWPELTLVVDPVLAASAGETFLDDAGIEVLLDELLPLGPVLTPNLPELARLASCSVDELGDLDRRVARGTELLERGSLAVLIKGGHGQEDPVQDLVLARAVAPVWHAHARVPGASLHGSGCRYAACVAAELAKGRGMDAAAEVAGRYLLALIAAASPRENS
jgi:hydroxymethylpyrimidine/phosphomethylpyrimidine kinase